jgi:hypothetical protein
MNFVYTDALVTNSSALQTAYWNSETNELAVHFWAGSVMKYSRFYSDDYRAFTNALSKGRFYTSYIKGHFTGEKLDDNTQFVHVEETVKEVKSEQTADGAPSVQVTVNIYVNGDPEQIAKAVERFAPSVRALQNWGR